jgi:hypothetical protein
LQRRVQVQVAADGYHRVQQGADAFLACHHVLGSRDHPAQQLHQRFL